MNLQNRIQILANLGHYLNQNSSDWQSVKSIAAAKNHWFTESFINLATRNIIDEFLHPEKLQHFAHHYHLDDLIEPKKIGIVMAGNIPMVGFHDFLCVFLCGHKQMVKLSSKDDLLLKHIFEYLIQLAPELKDVLQISERIGGCDAYIATGSNSSAAAFETYFGKYPSIIRRNKTSVAILDGSEDEKALSDLADDVHTFFGLGCRNVTKIYVPEQYDFIPLIHAFDKYAHFRDHHVYSNNYDYQLSLLLLNNVPYMSSKATLIVENKNPFSAISVLHYEYYDEAIDLIQQLKSDYDLQTVVGCDGTPFGEAQKPSLLTYADGKDTMQILLGL